MKVQVIIALTTRPPQNKMIRRAWNLFHWTLGRLVLATAICNWFIGAKLSRIHYTHTIAQGVVLGGLLIIYVLKNDVEYMLIKRSLAEEDQLVRAALAKGTGCIVLKHRHLWLHCFHAICQAQSQPNIVSGIPSHIPAFISAVLSTQCNCFPCRVLAGIHDGQGSNLHFICFQY